MGFMGSTWWLQKENNAKLRHRSTFDKSSPDFLGHEAGEMPAWNKKLSFNKISKEDLAEYVRNLDIKARKASRKQSFILIVSFLITAVVIMAVLNFQVNTRNEYREKLAAEKSKKAMRFIEDAQRYERLGQLDNARFQYQWALDIDTSNQIAKEGLERLREFEK